mgnify:FL=1
MKKINQVLATILLSTFCFITVSITYQEISKYRNKQYDPETIVVNKYLSPYVSEYVNILKSNDIKIPWGNDIVFIDMNLGMPSGVLGIAWGMDIDNITLISINISSWKYLSHQQRRYLVFHELTHDIFNLRHFDTEIMNTPMPMYLNKFMVDSAMKKLVRILKITDGSKRDKHLCGFE